MHFMFMLTFKKYLSLLRHKGTLSVSTPRKIKKIKKRKRKEEEEEVSKPVYT